MCTRNHRHRQKISFHERSDDGECNKITFFDIRRHDKLSICREKLAFLHAKYNMFTRNCSCWMCTTREYWEHSKHRLRSATDVVCNTIYGTKWSVLSIRHSIIDGWNNTAKAESDTKSSVVMCFDIMICHASMEWNMEYLRSAQKMANNLYARLNGRQKPIRWW